MKLPYAVLVAAACSSGDGASTPPSNGSAARRGTGLSASLSEETASAGSGLAGSSSSSSSGSGSGEGSGEGSAEARVAAPVIDAGVVAVDAAKAATVAPAHDSVKVTPELAAIKFELLPNWVRDEAGAATISLAVTVPKTGAKKTFVFHYGYDLPDAPVDREQYKKRLADQHLLTVTLDRQRGGAWYLEGTDGSGARAFRFVVAWGGKRLVCYGSAYRDAEHDPLGDLRDEVIVQAKKICESLSL